MSKEKTEVKRQTYSFEVIQYSDGTARLDRKNTGFSILELLGISALVQHDMAVLIGEAMGTKIKEVTRTSEDSPIIHK